jgi:nickel transport protein
MVRHAFVIMIFLLSVLHTETVCAHKASLFAYREGSTVYTEAYFVDGTPCRNAEITARATDGTVVAEGYTDHGGLFSFPYALSGDLTISVRAGMGHGGEFLLTVDKSDTLGSTPEGGDLTGEGLEGDYTIEGGTTPNEAAIERIVEEKIGPIRDSVREIRVAQGKPTLGKVLGGLGWILGLAGAYLWGVTRGKKHSS